MSWLLQRTEASDFAACGKYGFGHNLRLGAHRRERFHLTVPGFMIDTIEKCQHIRAGKTWPAWFEWPSHTKHKKILEKVYLQVGESALLKIYPTFFALRMKMASS